MEVFIAKFGREDYAWPDCLARSTIATMMTSLCRDPGRQTIARATSKTAWRMTRPRLE
jgi:hypothetical protein